LVSFGDFPKLSFHKVLDQIGGDRQKMRYGVIQVGREVKDHHLFRIFSNETKKEPSLPNSDGQNQPE